MKKILCLAVAVVLAVTAIASAQPFAYIVNSGTRNVSVVDTATDTITTTIPLPDTAQNVHPYAWGVTVGSSGQYVYVGLQDTNEVVVIDTARNAVVKRVGLGTNSPGGLAVNESETILYVTSHLSNLLLIYDISGSGAALVGAVAVSDAMVSGPEGVVLSPAGDKAYVANALAGSVAVVSVDETNNEYIRESVMDLGEGSMPMALAVSLDGDRLFVAGYKNIPFTAINLNTSARSEVFQTLGVMSITRSPDGSRLYVPSNIGDRLYEVTSTAQSTSVSGDYPLAAGPFGSSITPDGTKLYVTMNTGSYGDSVKVFDTAGKTVATTIPLPAGAFPTGIGSFVGPLFTYTITATSEPGCTILPAGPVAVNWKGRHFDINVSSGACEVMVDGFSVGNPNGYTLTNVSSNHTIHVRQSVGVHYTLTASWPQSGGDRYLRSTPAGISLASTSASFPANSTVTLSAPSGYQVSGWGGACAGTVGSSCTLVMDGDKYVSVGNISISPVCLVKRGSSCYATIDEAINSASSGDLIRVLASYTGPGISTSGGPAGGVVTLSGGWDSSFTTTSGFSTLGTSTFRAACAISVDGLIF